MTTATDNDDDTALRLPCPHLEDVLAPYLDSVAALADRLPAPRQIARPIYVLLLRKLARVVYNLPPIAALQLPPHDRGSYPSLLDTAHRRALRAVEGYAEDLGARATEESWRLALALYAAALCWDLGQILLLRIDIAGQAFTAGGDCLANACTAAGAHEYHVAPLPRSHAAQVHDDRSLALLLVPSVVPTQVLRRMRLENVNQLLWGLAYDLPDLQPPSQPLRVHLDRANVAIADRPTARREAADREATASVQTGHSLADDWTGQLRSLWRGGQLSCNDAEGSIFISASHTLIECEETRRQDAPFALIDAAMTTAPRGRCERGALLAELLTRFAAAPGPAPVLALATGSTRSPRCYVRHLADEDARTRSLWGIVVRNDLLWGDIDIAAQAGCFRGCVAFFHADRRRPGPTAAAYGFRPWRPPARGAVLESVDLGRVPFSTPERAGQAPEPALPPAEQSARLLWLLLDRVLPPDDRDGPAARIRSELGPWLAAPDTHLERGDLDLVLHHLVGRVSPDHLSDHSIAGIPSTPERSDTSGPIAAERRRRLAASLPETGPILTGLAAAIRAIAATAGPDCYDAALSCEADWIAGWNGECFALRWPEAAITLLDRAAAVGATNDRGSDRTLVADLDARLPDLAKALGPQLRCGPSGLPLHYVRLEGYRYPAHRRQPHHRLMLFAPAQQPAANPLRHRTLRCEWITLA